MSKSCPQFIESAHFVTDFERAIGRRVTGASPRLMWPPGRAAMRQFEGIAKAKAAGVYKGRPASIDAARVRELKAQGVGPTEIAKALKIGRASVYRVLEERTG